MIVAPSGSGLTFESHLGFPRGAGRASLTHANGNIHHVEAFGTQAAEGYFGDRAAFGLGSGDQ